MRRYADAGPGDARRPETHWSDKLEPGAPWVELSLQISISPTAWVERGVPPEEIQDRFDQLVERIKMEAVMHGVEAHATVSPELRGPHV